MKILLLSQFFRPVIGGEERVVEELGRELVARGHAVTVATTALEGEPAEEELDGMHVHRIPSLVGRAKALYTDSRRPHVPPAPDPGLVRGLEPLLAASPDVIHAHNWIVYSVLPWRRRHPAPLVLSLHDYGLVCTTKRFLRAGAPCPGPALARCLSCAGGHYGPAKGATTVVAQRLTSPWLRRSVDAYLPVSQAVARASGLDGQRFEVIPNFLPRAPTEAEGESGAVAGLLPEGEFLLFAGDVSRDKGADVLLAAHAGLDDPPPLVLIGRELIPRGDVDPGRVRFLGPQPHTAVLAAMRRCTALVAPSVWPEPFGLVALEAMAEGKPVIAARSGGLVDLVADGRTGLLVPPGDQRALGAAIRQLLEDAERRLALGRAAAAHAQLFSAENVVPRVEQVYESLLDRRRCR